MSTEVAPAKRTRHRSPSYPAIDLAKAVQRAKQLKLIADRHAAPLSSALEAWGYTLKSSNGLLTIAALKKFGLAADQGKQQGRQVRLTPLGYELVYYDDQRDTTEWKERARTAALTPTLHRELLAKYGGHLPIDSVIRPYLVLERGFSESAATEALKVFRASLVFAQIEPADSGGKVSPNEAEADLEGVTVAGQASAQSGTSLDLQTGHIGSPSQTAGAGGIVTRTIQIPYSRTSWAELRAEFPMSEASWKQLMDVLAAMKPSLVGDPDED